MQEAKKVQEVFEGNVFTFMCEQPDGTTNTLKAKATTWSKALDHFIDFARGAGYVISENAVQVPAGGCEEEYFNNLGVYEKED